MKKSNYRIAILFNANLDDRKGMTNAVLERIAYLKKYLPQEIEYDVICISYYFGAIARLFRNVKKQKRISECVINGIHIKIWWKRFFITDYLLNTKMRLSPIFAPIQNTRLSKELENYDLISAHSFLSAEIAYQTYSKHNIPYCVTWHGSDIHTNPFMSKYKLKWTKKIIENARYNFFVSKDLLNESKKITEHGYKELLYNGVGNTFHRFGDNKRSVLRRKHCIPTNTKIIAFVGGLISIKNANLLPDIFYQILKQTGYDVHFWIIGDGKLRKRIEQRIDFLGISNNVCLFGNVPHENMPELFNCIDLLILPSINEGLPLVTVEASRCGAMVIGSDVGGISEAIGKENAVPHGENFICRFAKRCLSALEGEYYMYINEELNWTRTAEKEANFYKSLLLKH